MSHEGIAPEVVRFIHECINSVAQLEILLLLHTDPRQHWTAEEIAQELRIEASGAEAQLAGLCAADLVVRDATPDATPANSASHSYRYAPATPALDAATVAVAQAYLVRRVTVTGLIFSKPSDGLRAFADAFRIRKEPSDG